MNHKYSLHMLLSAQKEGHMLEGSRKVLDKYTNMLFPDAAADEHHRVIYKVC
jgi:hypothetical protein